MAAPLHCPSCPGLLLRVRRRFDGVLVCGRCGDPLQRGLRPRGALPGRPGRRRLGLLLALALPLLALGLTLLQQQAGPALPAGLVGLDVQTLLQQLAEADRAWVPRAEPLPGGGTRYLYRRRAGEPELSVTEIRALMMVPPSHERERLAILSLLATLEQAGVRIALEQPHKQGAAGEWDPRSGAVRIKPDVATKGSVEFAQVLNHEAIHVAQSCSTGRLRASPRPLGLAQQLPPALAKALADPIYLQASPLEQRLEREAYANQASLELGAALLRRHCRLSEPAPRPS